MYKNTYLNTASDDIHNNSTCSTGCTYVIFPLVSLSKKYKTSPVKLTHKNVMIENFKSALWTVFVSGDGCNF